MLSRQVVIEDDCPSADKPGVTAQKHVTEAIGAGKSNEGFREGAAQNGGPFFLV